MNIDNEWHGDNATPANFSSDYPGETENDIVNIFQFFVAVFLAKIIPIRREALDDPRVAAVHLYLNGWHFYGLPCHAYRCLKTPFTQNSSSTLSSILMLYNEKIHSNQ